MRVSKISHEKCNVPMPPVKPPKDDEEWWTEYANDLCVTSVCRTVSTGDTTETTHVHFNRSRGKGPMLRPKEAKR